MSELSQGFILEIKEQIEQRIDSGHGRVRQSLNELKAEVQVFNLRLLDRLDEHERRSNRHSEQLVEISAERRTEKAAELTRRQDQRDRTVLVTTITSLTVTIGLFVLKALLNL